MQALPTLLDALSGLDRTGYDECRATRGLDAVAADVEQARNLGVRSTPTFFIGVLTAAGVQVTARVEGAKNLEVFREAIQTALRESARLNPQS